jgi:hypothetical protein
MSWNICRRLAYPKKKSLQGLSNDGRHYRPNRLPWVI